MDRSPAGKALLYLTQLFGLVVVAKCNVELRSHLPHEVSTLKISVVAMPVRYAGALLAKWRKCAVYGVICTSHEVRENFGNSL
jgi:hypothetical protein